MAYIQSSKHHIDSLYATHHTAEKFYPKSRLDLEAAGSRKFIIVFKHLESRIHGHKMTTWVLAWIICIKEENIKMILKSLLANWLTMT